MLYGESSDNPVGNTMLDDAGQEWVVIQVSDHDIPVYAWQQVTFATDPRTNQYMTLPQSAYPAEFVISMNGVLWQVSRDGNSWVTVYDITLCNPPVSSNTPPAYLQGVSFQVVATGTIILPNSYSYFYATLDPTFQWPSYHSDGFIEYNVTRLATTGVQLNSSAYFTVQQAVPASSTAAPQYVVKLDTVSNLVPGDTLILAGDPARANGATLTLNDLDAQNMAVILDAPLPVYLNAGDLLTLGADSLDSVIFTRFQDLAGQAMGILAGGSSPATTIPVDFTKFQNPILPEPALSWMDLTTGDPKSSILCPYDIQTQMMDLTLGNWLMGVQQGVLPGQATQGWIGTPGTTWYNLGPWIPYVSWTNQLLTPPSFEMPYNTGPFVSGGDQTLASRNRPAINITRLDQVDADVTIDDGVQAPTCVAAFDYVGALRWLFTRPSGSSATTITSSLWLGRDMTQHQDQEQGNWTDWYTASWAGNPIVQACPFPSVSLTGRDASSLVLLDNAGNLILYNGTVLASINLVNAADTTAQLGLAQLVQTPYGVYLVGQQGYGLITYNSGVLACNYAPIPQDSIGQGLYLIATTFVAYDANTIFCMAACTTTDASGKTTAETYLFNLNPNPQAVTITNPLPQIGGGTYNQTISLSASDMVLLQSDGVTPRDFEKVIDGVPRIAMAVKSPTDNTIYGLLGSRVFQISQTMSAIVEKFSGNGLTVANIIEDLCITQNAVAVPMPSGTLKIVSRTYYPETITQLTNVDIINLSEIRMSPWFFSQVNVKGATDDIVGTALGMGGGIELEFDTVPFIFTDSEARAIALSYASFFGWPRQMMEVEMSWRYGGVAPWETLQPMDVITLNGSTDTWYVVKLSYSLMSYTCKLTLLQTQLAYDSSSNSYTLIPASPSRNTAGSSTVTANPLAYSADELVSVPGSSTLVPIGTSGGTTGGSGTTAPTINTTTSFNITPGEGGSNSATITLPTGVTSATYAWSLTNSGASSSGMTIDMPLTSGEVNIPMGMTSAVDQNEVWYAWSVSSGYNGATVPVAYTLHCTVTIAGTVYNLSQDISVSSPPFQFYMVDSNGVQQTADFTGIDSGSINAYALPGPPLDSYGQAWVYTVYGDPGGTLTLSAGTPQAITPTADATTPYYMVVTDSVGAVAWTSSTINVTLNSTGT